MGVSIPTLLARLGLKPHGDEAVGKVPLDVGDEADLYSEGAEHSIVDYIPWVEYDQKTEAFLFDDGASVGAIWEALVVDAEARPAEYLRQVRDGFVNALHAIPEYEDNPWVVQFYAQDEPIKSLISRIKHYIRDDILKSEYTQHYLDIMEQHLERITRPGGLFFDTKAGVPWRGRVRRVRICLYRRSNKTEWPKHDRWPTDELNDVAPRFTEALNDSGVITFRGSGRDMYEWMFPWMSPAPASSGGDPYRYMEERPYPVEDECNDDLPFSFDLASMMFASRPEPGPEGSGIWRLGGKATRYIPFQGLSAAPRIGHFTIADESMGGRASAIFDRLPEGSVLAITVVIMAEEQVQAHLTRIQKASVAGNTTSGQAKRDAEDAVVLLANECKLLPTSMGVYLTADSEKELKRQSTTVVSALRGARLNPLETDDDPVGQYEFIINLPMCYNANHIKLTKRSRLNWTHHVANLLPLFGRGTGTGNPGLLFFNRTAEPLMFDMLSSKDRLRNAHMLMFGPSGAGKSASAIYINSHVTAIHRPRWFIIEAGNSFGLWAEDCRRNGLTVNHIRITPSADVGLNPFADATRLLEIEEAAVNRIDDDTDDDAEEESRDLMGEMEIAARFMITGGEQKEENKMGRADRMMIRQAILSAARWVRDQSDPDIEQVLPEHIADEMDKYASDATLAEEKRRRASEMADALRLFCSGLQGRFFNRPGKPWPDVDITLIDLGILATEGYRDTLSVTIIGLMQHVNALVEREQHSKRHTIIEIDEAHNITTDKLMAAYFVKVSKMWRKLGAWLWQLTQNLADYPDDAKKMLSMAEWWLCLSMPKDEIQNVARFIELTDETRTLLASAGKEPGKYVEGVVLSSRITSLYRSVVPALFLSVAGTEKDEKAARKEVMNETGCDELEAAYVIAERMANKVAS